VRRRRQLRADWARLEAEDEADRASLLGPARSQSMGPLATLG
jgi:hypothetical protein